MTSAEKDNALAGFCLILRAMILTGDTTPEVIAGRLSGRQKECAIYAMEVFKEANEAAFRQMGERN